MNQNLCELHQKIINLAQSEDEEYARHGDLIVARIFFKNFRTDGKTSSGKRLTELGLNFLILHFWYREIFDFSNLYGRELVFFENHCNLPYYVDKKKIVIFEMDLSSAIGLCSGDISKVREIFST